MATKKDEIPQHQKDYEKFKKESRLIKNTFDVFDLHHDKIRAETMLKHLTNEDGDAEYDRLNKKEVRDAVAKDLVKGYDTVISNYYKTDMKSLSNKKKEILRNSLMGTTQASLVNSMEALGKDFGKESYNQIITKKLMQNLSDALVPTTFAHINPNDIPELLKHAKLDHKFDPEKIKLLKDPTYKAVIGRLLYDNHITKGNLPQDYFSERGLDAYLARNKD